MNGARSYANMFRTGQYGRLFLDSGSHARGKTFHIWVLPHGVEVASAPWSVDGAVEVYGIVSGQPGWTESYGWLHYGKWQEDFATLVEKRLVEITAAEERMKADAEAKQLAKEERISDLLSTY